MNYQPFLEMNILVSDDLIQVLIPVFNVFLVLVLIFVCVVFHLYLKDRERKERF